MKMEKIYPQPVTPGTTNVFSVVELITPERAEKILASSPGNRKSKTIKIERYASQMKDGKWCLVPDHIAIDENGLLINGHNRLMAVIKANISVLMQVDYNIKRSDMPNIDIGSVRSSADMLSFLFTSIENYTMVAGAVRMLIPWFKNGETGIIQNDVLLVTNAEIIDFVYENEEEIINTRITKPFIGSPSVVFAACFVLNRICREDSTKFFYGLKTGYELSKGSPILALREQITRRVYKSNTDRIEMFAKTFKAWNLWRNDKICGSLRWMPTEEFPIPR